MTLRRLFLLIIVAVAIIAGGRWMRDPHRTALPFGSTDLSGVQKELARLPSDERALVEAYVARSRGDVLPAKFADPDAPLTARTFGEAITLERTWKVKTAAEAAEADKRRAARDARLAPLRAIVDASVVRAEILTESEYRARQDPGYRGAERSREVASFVTRIRVENLGDQPIVAMRGSLQARDKEAPLPLDLCWIDFSQRELAPRESTEIDCGKMNRAAGAQERAFVDDSGSRFEVEWSPRYVRLADGRELDAGL
jgi:hypothetical protein